MLTFTKVEDWLARRTDLTSLEKLIISKILRYGKRGCFQGYGSLARDLGVDRTTLIRNVKSLINKRWVAPLYETKYKRILYVTEEILAEKEPDLFSISSGRMPPQVVAKCPASSGKMPPVVDYVSYSEERKKIEKEIDFLSDTMREEAKPLTQRQFQERKSKLIKQLQDSKWASPKGK